MYRVRTLLILFGACAALLAAIFVQGTSQDSNKSVEPALKELPPIRPIASMGARPAPQVATWDQHWRTHFDSVQRRTGLMDAEEQRELLDGLSLTIIAKSRRIGRYESPKFRAFLRNDSRHAATLMSGSGASAWGQVPVLAWRVALPSGSLVRPHPGGICGNQNPPALNQFDRLEPGEEMEIITMDLHQPFRWGVNEAGRYEFQLEYSTEPDYPHSSSSFYEDFQRAYPVISERMPRVTLRSNVVSVEVTR